MSAQYIPSLWHRLLLLKLDKQISGTIYWPIIAVNEAQRLEGVGCSTQVCLVGCRLPPLDGYMAMCLVLTIDIYVSGPAIGHTLIPHQMATWLCVQFKQQTSMSLVLQLVIVLCPTRWPHGYVSSLNNGHLCLWSCNWSYLDAPLRLENGYVSSLNNRHICLWSCNWSYLDAPLRLENGYVSSFNNRHLCLWSCNWSYLDAPLGLEYGSAVRRILVRYPEDECLRGTKQQRDEPGHHDHLG